MPTKKRRVRLAAPAPWARTKRPPPRITGGFTFKPPDAVRLDAQTAWQTHVKDLLTTVIGVLTRVEWSQRRTEYQLYPHSTTRQAPCCPDCHGVKPGHDWNFEQGHIGHRGGCELRQALQELEQLRGHYA